MKIKDGFILREVAGSYIGLAVGKRTAEFNGVINLSETAANIWKLLQKDTTEEEVLKGMQEIYDADEETLRRDVKAFIGKLMEAGLLE